jgi:AraC family transcriptional regulator, regulatory protein of adaptative response / methylphosphotriester-DNA alkyltransferase methyltransferase
MTRQRTATVRHRASLFREAVAIVESDFGAALSLDEVARRVAASRRQLQRAYTEIGGTTFRGHLADVRMERAAELLTRSEMPVRDVARHVGYQQAAQFAKAFRRRHGVAPARYRASQRVAAVP